MVGVCVVPAAALALQDALRFPLVFLSLLIAFALLAATLPARAGDIEQYKLAKAAYDDGEYEVAAERFGRVVIGSGDGIFAQAAARLQAVGTEVTVVCGEGALARRLRMAARDVRFLPRELEEPCAVNLLRAVA